MAAAVLVIALTFGATPSFATSMDKLLDAVEMTESHGNIYARSPVGAEGAFQFMPDTARRFGINPWDEAQARVGAEHYLNWLLERYNGNLDMALAGWNWGEYGVDRMLLRGGWNFYRLPHETQSFIRTVHRYLGYPGPYILHKARHHGHRRHLKHRYKKVSGERFTAPGSSGQLQYFTWGSSGNDQQQGRQDGGAGLGSGQTRGEDYQFNGPEPEPLPGSGTSGSDPG